MACDVPLRQPFKSLTAVLMMMMICFRRQFADASNACEILIDKGADVDARTENGHSPVFSCAEFHKPNALRALIKHGANVKVKNKNLNLLSSIRWLQLLEPALFDAFLCPLSCEATRGPLLTDSPCPPSQLRG